MGRKKKAVAQIWNAINKQRDEQARNKQEEFSQKNTEEITPEEQERRIKKLKALGLIKENLN